VTALLARPWAGELASDPTAVLVVLFVALGAVGAWWPLPAVTRPVPRSVAVTVAVVGVAAFGAGRLLAGGRAAAPALAVYVVLNTLAAVAEEAFFRRLLYGVLERHGQTVAVVGSAAAFAVVHLTVWGAWALPLDLAAGLLLSWQRAVTGRWSVPAFTHAAANVLAVV
jgi:membrane protease YdiL (CAAX protease family)